MVFVHLDVPLTVESSSLLSELFNGGGAPSLALPFCFLFPCALYVLLGFSSPACMSGGTTESSHQGEVLMGRVVENRERQHWVRGKL